MRSAVKVPFYFWDKVLPDEACDMIIQQGLALDNFKSAGVNSDNTKDPDLRQGSIAWFDKESQVDALLASYLATANVEAKWTYILTESEKVQFSIYGLQSRYGWHRDTDIKLDDGVPIRKVSVSVQLSHPDDYEGGDFEIKNFFGHQLDNNKKELRNRGTIIVFPSFLEHQVTPVTKGTRYSLVQWYSGPDWR